MNPNELTPKAWATRYAAYKSHNVPDDDPRVIECRQALAHHRAHGALDASVVAALSDVSREQLMAILRGDQAVKA